MLAGLFEAGLDGLAHSTLDSWWHERGFRGDANDLPILMINGFFDVESRGAFQGYRALRRDGAHSRVGAHDGAPAGTDGGVGEARDWLDRYVRGGRNGVERPAAGAALARRRRPRGLARRALRPRRRPRLAGAANAMARRWRSDAGAGALVLGEPGPAGDAGPTRRCPRSRR